MADGEKRGGKGKGHGVKGKNIAGQYRAIFAKGHLRRKGKGGGKDGKGGGLTYTKKVDATAARTFGRTAKRAGLSGGAKNNGVPGNGRFAIGGKTASLRGGGGRPRSREDRIAAGRAIANRPDVARKALKGSGLRVTENRPRAGTPLAHVGGPLNATGKRSRLTGDTRFLVRTARKDGLLKERATPAGSRGARIAAGREKAAAFLASERGQRLRSGVEGLRDSGRRTGRKDHSKPAKVKAAKDDLRAAKVKIKTGQNLAQRYDIPRLRGDYSRPTIVQRAPKYAAQQTRAEGRARTLASVAGKSRADRIAAGKAIASQPLNQGKASIALRDRFERKRSAGLPTSRLERTASRPYRINDGKLIAGRAMAKRADQQRQEAARVAQERAAMQREATNRRLQGRRNRVARGEAKKEAATAQRLSARNKRAAKVEGLERSRRIAAGRRVLAEFRKRRDSQYNGSLF